MRAREAWMALADANTGAGVATSGDLAPSPGKGQVETQGQNRHWKFSAWPTRKPIPPAKAPFR